VLAALEDSEVEMVEQSQVVRAKDQVVEYLVVMLQMRPMAAWVKCKVPRRVNCMAILSLFRYLAVLVEEALQMPQQAVVAVAVQSLSQLQAQSRLTVTFSTEVEQLPTQAAARVEQEVEVEFD
jgi:hypothetical protein